MELPVKNVFVEYMDEDALLRGELFKHAEHMSVMAGYKANYNNIGKCIDDETCLVQHTFFEHETRDHMFDLYEVEDSEARTYDKGSLIGRTSERMIQVVIPLKTLKKRPHVKEDLELLCSRAFRKNPDWITMEEAPIPMEKEKPGCFGFLYGLLKS